MNRGGIPGLALVLSGVMRAGGPVTDAVPTETLMQAPAVTITNGAVAVKLFLPDPAKGFYRGSRFDWGGIIGSLTYQGHDFYVPWFGQASPSVRDYVLQNDTLINSTNNATGPAEEFTSDGGALGYEEASPGGTFLKIGVGLLRRLDVSAYNKFEPYTIVDPGRRQTLRKPDRVKFIQDIASPSSGYGYRYIKTIRLDKSRPVMFIEHELRNTGSRTLTTQVSNHNFLNIDNRGTPRGLQFATPFTISLERPLDPDMAQLEGSQITFLRRPATGEITAATVTGYSSAPSDNSFRFVDPEGGASVRIKGDRPLAHLIFWSIQPVVAIEPFVQMSIAPGQSFEWTYRYEFQAE